MCILSRLDVECMSWFLSAEVARDVPMSGSSHLDSTEKLKSASSPHELERSKSERQVYQNVPEYANQIFGDELSATQQV